MPTSPAPVENSGYFQDVYSIVQGVALTGAVFHFGLKSSSDSIRIISTCFLSGFGLGIVNSVSTKQLKGVKLFENGVGLAAAYSLFGVWCAAWARFPIERIFTTWLRNLPILSLFTIPNFPKVPQISAKVVNPTVVICVAAIALFSFMVTYAKREGRKKELPNAEKQDGKFKNPDPVENLQNFAIAGLTLGTIVVTTVYRVGALMLLHALKPKGP